MHRPIAAFASLVLVAASSAQESPIEPPPQKTLEQRVDHLFRACQRPGAPGAVVLVARGDDVLLEKAYGLADLEREVPLSPRSVFDIGSTSKQFTAACALLLEQDGALSLQDPVRKHVDELPACCDGVTLRHLMLHTSGVPDYIGLLLEAGKVVEDHTTTDDALAALAKVEALDFATGTEWQYSNSNYLLLSVVAERVSGLNLAQLAEERIFAPLGMNDTHVHRDCTALVKRRALSYSRGPGGWRWHFSNWEQTGDGAVFTTVADLLRWARNFESGKVGGEALLAAMSKPGALDDGTAIDYGAGLMWEQLDGHRVVAHGGAWAGYRAELLRIPSQRIVVVCLFNRDDMHPSRRAQRIAKFVLAEPQGR